ncbi:hypothetical protein GLAREA_09519 [Glarea lozoyensis ATCC 20868]|uniref:2EXR domain-containing protein n=1 Tax=Glarea lozoyensis (strain ATCC 20868 / MF5171) TaxID=1116229 RepID=S3CTP6_GLAL2|nr:uncharacterized protein GLAREA_09519 [Glarea lozoyensis ATCC 20868]EPE28399.1 hypothetical protein GLAREA_09519 [Glarea lozoyensis ATCC 20868]
MYPSSLIFAMQHQHRHCVIVRGNTVHVKAIRSFRLFPLLPPEIRLAIWTAIADEPRNIELSCTPTLPGKPHGQWFSHTLPPILMSICSESRSYALSRYSSLTFSESQLGNPCKKTVYIDFETEALWLCGDLHPKFAADLLLNNQQLQENLKHMKIDAFLWRKLEAMGSGPTRDGGYEWPDAKALVHCSKELQITTFHS